MSQDRLPSGLSSGSSAAAMKPRRASSKARASVKSSCSSTAALARAVAGSAGWLWAARRPGRPRLSMNRAGSSLLCIVVALRCGAWEAGSGQALGQQAGELGGQAIDGQLRVGTDAGGKQGPIVDRQVFQLVVPPEAVGDSMLRVLAHGAAAHDMGAAQQGAVAL